MYPGKMIAECSDKDASGFCHVDRRVRSAPSVKPKTIPRQCQYERNFGRSHDHATEEELEALAYYEEHISDATSRPHLERRSRRAHKH